MAGLVKQAGNSPNRGKIVTNDDSSKANSVKFAAQTFTAGQKLAGCYTLQRKLESAASEGITVAWLARDEELQRDIALYFLPDSVMADSRAMSELRQEVKRNRQMIHPHILRVHELIEEADWAAICMDHVEAESVAAVRGKSRAGHSRFPKFRDGSRSFARPSMTRTRSICSIAMLRRRICSWRNPGNWSSRILGSPAACSIP